MIYKCTDSYDEAASNANKTKLLAEHRDQVFNEYLDSYLKEHQALFNDQAWGEAEHLRVSGSSIGEFLYDLSTIFFGAAVDEE